jgi:hypothetical protein
MDQPMRKDYSVEAMIWALGGLAVALAAATALSILFSLW